MFITVNSDIEKITYFVNIDHIKCYWIDTCNDGTNIDLGVGDVLHSITDTPSQITSKILVAMSHVFGETQF